MPIGMLAVLSLLPIIAVAVFLVVLRWPASRAMPVCYFVAVALALFVWKVPGPRVAAASVNGLVIAGKLLFIIFGAAGTPILIGVNGGLISQEAVATYVSSASYSWNGYLAVIGARVALLHAIAGVLVPLIVVCFLTRFFGRNKSFREGLRVWKFALFAGLAMVIPYVIVAWTLGPEFPTLFGSLIGLAIVTTAARKGFLMPPREEHWEFDDKANWNPEWSGTIEIRDDNDDNRTMGLMKAWSPYLLVVLLLVLTRLPALPLAEWVSWKVQLPKLFGTDIAPSFKPLYLPGSIFILVSLITWFVHRIPASSYGRAWTSSVKTGLAASIALVFTVPMVQVFINSNGGAAGYVKMPIALAEGVAALADSAWPIFAPFIGGIGAFVAGSNTISNMMFSLFQFDVGRRIGVDPTWIVALQAVGGAAGNMICVHNVVAASAVVGLLGKEGLVIRRTLLPFVYYALLTGASGYSIVWFSKYGLFNMGTVIAALIAVAAVVIIFRGTRNADGTDLIQ